MWTSFEFFVFFGTRMVTIVTSGDSHPTSHHWALEAAQEALKNREAGDSKQGRILMTRDFVEGGSLDAVRAVERLPSP